MLKINCAYFKGDQPCKFHKEDGVKCDDCNHYKPVKNKILIIKLDAIGDVLRTTSILEPLKEKYPDSHITWCTREEAKELFVNNELVNDVIFVNDDSEYRLAVEKFNIVINLDTSKISSAISANAIGDEKVGFILNEKGSVVPTSEAAKEWLLMSAFDDYKAANKKSYQQLMYNILDLSSPVSHPILNIKKNNSELLRNKYSINDQQCTLGLNTGVGTKWPSKGWPLSRWEELIQKLKEDQLNLLLLGGPEEKKKNEYLTEKYDYLINTGCDNSIMDFACILNLCDILVTADTFALHIGIALRKYVIALFGPTSMAEIEIYNNGQKTHAQYECECYYQKSCNQNISCMEKISADTIYESIKSYQSTNLN